MTRKAVFLAIPLALMVCAARNPPPRDPTRPNATVQAQRTQQHAQALTTARARLAKERARCKRGNRRACARATAAKAVLDDLNGQAIAPEAMPAAPHAMR
ncbi:hypothetical protein [Novosphingobium pokkalii]|uniref:Uncharacterized protein n=1 Tax=Novosphingobium pokkalii TaxID=1770194 RepID=A0ABV7V211_9SPHN|nr:hypothetical protein [Novosphingobium pokkalii]GHC85389.1 hypothetical protein GCM10019060_06090 [Novosphingobium pokkalii]